MTSRKLLHTELTVSLKATTKEIDIPVKSKLVHLSVCLLSDLF